MYDTPCHDGKVKQGQSLEVVTGMAQALINIGKAAEASGLSAKMIRYYESIGLVEPTVRTSSGYRQYSDTDVQTLRFIKRARDLGFSLDRIQTLVGLWRDTQRKSQDVKRLAYRHIEELDRDIAKLQSIRAQLQHLADFCHGDNRPDCPILDDLSSGTVLADSPHKPASLSGTIEKGT